jgi:hypothetical protein
MENSWFETIEEKKNRQYGKHSSSKKLTEHKVKCPPGG